MRLRNGFWTSVIGFMFFTQGQLSPTTKYMDVVVLVDTSTESYLPLIRKGLNESIEDPSVQLGYVRDVNIDNVTTHDLCHFIVNEEYPPTFVIDTTQPPKTHGMVNFPLAKRIVRTMGIPTISTTYGQGRRHTEWGDLDDIERELLVHIPPPKEHMADIILDLVVHLKMNSAAVFYDPSFAMDRQYNLLLDTIPLNFIVRPLGEGLEGIFQSIMEIGEAKVHNIFVLGSIETLDKVATVSGLYMHKRKDYAWFFITKDDDNLMGNCTQFTYLLMRPKIMDDDEDILSDLKRLNPQEKNVDLAFYYDIARFGAKVVSKEMAAGTWPEKISYPKCGQFLSEEHLNQRKNMRFSSAMEQDNFEGIFGGFQILENGENFQEIMIEMIQTESTSDCNEEETLIGVWNYGKPSGEFVFKSNLNLDNLKIITVYRAAVVIQPPFVMKKVTNGTVEYYGYCIDIINEIKEKLGFEYVIFETKDGLYGSYAESESEWNGIMKDLVEKRADIGLGPMAVMRERELVVDFTVPIYDMVGIIIMMKRNRVPSTLFKFLTVLEPSVWACILGAYFVTSFLLFIFDRFSPYSFQNNQEKYKDDEEKRIFTFKESLWFCITSLTPQGGGEAPRNLSGRLVAATWWLFGFIIIASYTANLAAFLTVSRLESSIISLDHLIRQYKTKYSVIKGTATQQYFERMKYIEDKFYEIWKDMSLDDTLNDTERAKLAVWEYPVSDKYTKIYNAMNEYDHPANFEAARQKVLRSRGNQEGFALIGDYASIEFAVLTSCDLRMVGQEFSRKPVAFAVQKGSPLKEQMSGVILNMLNSRRLEELKEKWWASNPERVTCEDSLAKTDGISLYGVGGVFIVIFAGLLMSCAALLFEYWLYKGRKGATKADVITIQNFAAKMGVKMQAADQTKKKGKWFFRR